MLISDVVNRPEWKNTSTGIWHKYTNGKSWGQIYYERICPKCKNKFAASTKHVIYCSNSCHSSVFQVGEKSHKWRGGKIRNKRGYIQVLVREHPYATKPNFYVLEHRLVMEKKIGRYLRPGETVHHINGIKHDNRPNNLVLISSQADHVKIHNDSRSPETNKKLSAIKKCQWADPNSNYNKSLVLRGRKRRTR